MNEFLLWAPLVLDVLLFVASIYILRHLTKRSK